MRMILLLVIGLTVSLGYTETKAAETDYSSNIILNKPDTSVLDSLLVINYDSYINQPVDSLLEVLPVNRSATMIISGSRAHIAESLLLEYEDRYVVKIYVRDYQHMNPIDYKRKWDVYLFRKELITHIIVKKDNECMIRCGHEGYID